MLLSKFQILSLLILSLPFVGKAQTQYLYFAGDYISEFGNKSIYSINLNKSTPILIGTSEGLFIQTSSNNFKLVEEWMLDNRTAIISKVFVDSKNDIWVATLRSGLIKVSSNGGVPQYSRFIINNTVIQTDIQINDIIEYGKSLWVSTNNGLFKSSIKGQLLFTQVKLPKDQNMPTYYLCVFQNELFISTEFGLVQLKNEKKIRSISNSKGNTLLHVFSNKLWMFKDDIFALQKY
jgi:ligand-binding sensor domain-containing protein